MREQTCSEAIYVLLDALRAGADLDAVIKVASYLSYLQVGCYGLLISLCSFCATLFLTQNHHSLRRNIFQFQMRLMDINFWLFSRPLCLWDDEYKYLYCRDACRHQSIEEKMVSIEEKTMQKFYTKIASILF